MPGDQVGRRITAFASSGLRSPDESVGRTSPPRRRNIDSGSGKVPYRSLDSDSEVGHVPR